MPVSVRLSVLPSVCDGSALAHYSDSYLRPRTAAAVLLIVLLAGSSSRAMLTSARLSCSFPFAWQLLLVTSWFLYLRNEIP